MFVQDMISKLLVHQPNARLGCVRNGTREVMSHPFFKCDFEFCQWAFKTGERPSFVGFLRMRGVGRIGRNVTCEIDRAP